MKNILKNIIKNFKKDKNLWINNEIGNKLKYIKTDDEKTKKIIETKNIEQLKSLNEDEIMDVLIKLNYDYYCKIPFEALNHEQKVLFLCMSLEGACQADTILSLHEEGIMLQMPEIYEALIEIGAPITASLVKEFINLLPPNTFEDMILPDWNWFYKDMEIEDKIRNIDSKISNYPDGSMQTIYYKYVTRENVAEKLFSFEQRKDNCIVFYEGWQLECCGKDFKINSIVKWPVCNGNNIKLPIKTKKIDYYYEAHDDRDIYILEGKVKKIKALYEKYEPSKDNPRILVATDGILFDIKSSIEITREKNNMDFSGYLVYIENYSIRLAKKNEIPIK